MDYRAIEFPKDSLFLVTGGAGFIGSNLCEALISMGHRVRCLDDLSTGLRENVVLLSGEGSYSFIRGDVRVMDDCVQAVEGVDYVLHQAAWGSVPRSIEMPVFYAENNVLGMVNMLEASRQAGVKRFVYASSSSVYGDAAKLPKVEGKEGAPLSPYALSKKVDEEYGMLYARLYGLQTFGLRYFNVFGRRQNPEGAYAAVIPRMVRQLMRGEAPVIHGDGKQSRDFTYIDNVIQANLLACAAPAEAAGQVFNIATGKRETLLEVYKAIEKLLGTRIEPTFGPARQGDVRHSHADITRARELLGYAPEWDFQRGIAAAIEWYKAHA